MQINLVVVVVVVVVKTPSHLSGPVLAPSTPLSVLAATSNGALDAVVEEDFFVL